MSESGTAAAEAPASASAVFSPEAQARIGRLERKLAALEKINRALMSRVERSTASTGDSYSMFVHNLTLQHQVAEQTDELQANNRQLHKALNDLQSATDQIIQSEKLAALGSLVAGIAHEVNTPLGVGVTAASLLEEATAAIAKSFEAGTMKKSEFTGFVATCQESVRIILANLGRAANLIQSFKKIAVDQSSESWQVIALKGYLDDIIVSLTPKLKKTKIRVVIDCPPDLRINTMPGALSQIVTNLVTNSLVHAFDAGQEGEISITAALRKNAIALIYADNGKGIARENLAKIFEPFFTTKRGQGGSGLGLHLVYNIVHRNLKGRIEVASTPGEGARFTITLPDCLVEPAKPANGEEAKGGQ
ncbi:MAG: HAMP domain-containing histidine kinase [Candidatus Accumulibacter sp.]|jgi:signal transduction histidine kinase|nr:HAMP domain-containing histidine kinase [Accumulibacter sp.]